VDTGVRLPPAVEGWITRAYTAGPVSGATVAINGLTLATSDASGHFEVSASQLQNAGIDVKQSASNVTVTVRAAGLLDWQLERATYYKADTLRLYPRLASAKDPAVLSGTTSGISASDYR